MADRLPSRDEGVVAGGSNVRDVSAVIEETRHADVATPDHPNLGSSPAEPSGQSAGNVGSATGPAARQRISKGRSISGSTAGTAGLVSSFSMLLSGGLAHVGGAAGGAAARRVELEEADISDGWILVDGDRSQPPPFHLRVSDGKYVGSLFAIPPLGSFPTIGRSRRNPICLLADDQVSRFHAFLMTTSDGRVLLKDGSRESQEASSNGTFVNSNCTRIDSNGYCLFPGDVIAIGATEMIVELGALSESECTNPPLQVATPGNWIRPENENPWKRQMEKGPASATLVTEISNARKLAFLMGTHARVGERAPVSSITDSDLLALIMRNCRVTIQRAPPPPFPGQDKPGHQDVPMPLDARCFPGGFTAQEFLNNSSPPFPGACGGYGGHACVAFEVTRVTQVYNSSLWRPYHWRKQCISERLPDLSLLHGSCALRERPMGTGPFLDSDANEFYAFHGQSVSAIDTIKDAGLCQEAASPTSLFGGGVYLSCSAFRANMAVPCARCGCGSIGRAPCTCAWLAQSQALEQQPEQALLIARVTLGDAHICESYDASVYRGPTERPRRCPPLNPETGHRHDSIVGESAANGGPCLFREIVVFDRFQCYPEFVVHYKRVTAPEPPTSTPLLVAEAPVSDTHR